jgi:protein phosphatase
MSAELSIPELALVVLVGASGSGKSTFARSHFLPTEIVSSDACRAMVSDSENDQSATPEAFELLHFIARKRLAAGRMTVVDATNVQSESRTPLVAIAREHHCIPVAIVLNMPERLCLERNALRGDRPISPHAVRQQIVQLRRSLRDLKQQGFRHIFVLETPEEVAAARVTRQPLWNNRREEHGPFDIIGDIHGCYDELAALLRKLGYELDDSGAPPRCQHPAGRKAVFLGDLIDRGPKIVEVLELVMAMVGQGSALCVPGNHEAKLLRKLRGKDVRVSHGLKETLDQLSGHGDSLQRQIADFIDGLVSHYVLDDGKLVVAHAGLKQGMQGRGSGAVREFCLYGETTGETDEYGLPVRYNWASDYRGRALVVYGHTPVPYPEWQNNTLCIDTGCVFGGALTALRYPERELVQVEAARAYYESAKPLNLGSVGAGAGFGRPDDLLDAEDVLGKRRIETRVMSSITVQAENAAAALETMSRFAVDPRWLIYLPPTMSPCETAKSGPYLEHPREALAYFREQGVQTVIGEEKHMGSRAVIVLCRDEATARGRFRTQGDELGVCYTRSGRPFFGDAAMTRGLLLRLHAALDRSGLWEELGTNWICLDAEILPWSAKAQELLRRQYAASATAAETVLPAALAALGEGEATAQLRQRLSDRLSAVTDYRAAYRRYCWPARTLADYRVAPFHLLASEGQLHSARDHVWHMQTLAKLAAADPDFFLATRYQLVNLSEPQAEAVATAFWEQHTAAGGEGLVFKPLDWIVHGKRGLVQPAVKCRGREYLRIIYGPEYSLPSNLERLRPRGLSVKRGLALREFALGLEALARFVERAPLYRVHECAFAVLALESEPIDPRL